MNKRYIAVLLFLAIVVPFSQAYAAPAPCSGQSQTVGPVYCNGDCTEKFIFSCFPDIAVEFAATGTCSLTATLSLTNRQKLEDLTVLDVQANQGDEEFIDTECMLPRSRNKCAVVEITHQGCTAEEITYFFPPSNVNVSPRMCECAAGDLNSCLQTGNFLTAGVGGFWPSGTDPIKRPLGGGASHYWPCSQVFGDGLPACTKGYLLQGNTAKVGSSYPVKFTVVDCATGTTISDAKVLISIQWLGRTDIVNGEPVLVECPDFCPVDLSVGSTSSEEPPLYRFTGSHYQFNWVPLEAGSYEITSITLNYNLPQQSIIINVIK
jgi:hypothetical protein